MFGLGVVDEALGFVSIYRSYRRQTADFWGLVTAATKTRRWIAY